MTDYIDVGQDWINDSGTALTAGGVVVPAGATATYLGSGIWELTQASQLTAAISKYSDLSLTAVNLAISTSITSLTGVRNIADDGVLSNPSEKQKALDAYNGIISRLHILDTQADYFSLTSEKSTCHSAIDILIAYCATLTSPTLWSNKTVGAMTNIDPIVFPARFSAAYAALDVYLNSIINYASKTSLSYSQAMQPTATKGAVWLDTSSTQKVVKTCVDGVTWIELAKVVTKGSDIGVADNATYGATNMEVAAINLALTHRIYQTTDIKDSPTNIPTTTAAANVGNVPYWSNTSSVPLSGKTQWQCDGCSDSVTGVVTWGIPYLSQLTVGTLDAFGVSTGRLLSGALGRLLTINAEQAQGSLVETHEFRCYNDANLVASMGDSDSGGTQEEIFRANVVNTTLRGRSNKITAGYTAALQPVAEAMGYNSKTVGVAAFTAGSNVYTEICSMSRTGLGSGVADVTYGGYFKLAGTTDKEVYLSAKTPTIDAAGYFSWGGKSAQVCTSTYALDITGNLNVAGTIYASQNITAFSDRRLKENLVKIDGALDSVDKISGYSFDWIIKKTHDVGIIADEIEAIIPEAVFEHPDGFKVVDYTKIIPLLIEGIKELRLEIKELKRDFNS